VKLNPKTTNDNKTLEKEDLRSHLPDG